jgi:hypothetical protein
MGLEAFHISPDDVEYMYCLPHSLPYFMEEEVNRIPARWISNGETLNNTFSLITSDVTYSLSIVPPDYRLSNEFNPDVARDYYVYFGKDEEPVEVPLFAKANLQENNEIIHSAGSILAIANHFSAVRQGEPVKRQFIVHVTRETGQYTTGRHIGQFMAYVPYEKEINSMDLYVKSMDYLLENQHIFNRSKEHGNNFWGSVHSRTGAAFGNGTAYYAMYGNSFSMAALNQYAKMGQWKEQYQNRLDGVQQFLTNSNIQNKDGSYWSMLALGHGKFGYADQAYREWVQTHATAWVCYYLLESYEISGDKEVFDAARRGISWLVQQQNDEGWFPKYFDKGKPSKDKQGDIGWNALAFFKAAELNVMPENVITSDQLVQRGLKAVDWICDSLVQTKKFFGSFEDVGGVVDSYASTVCARAAIKAFEASQDPKYRDAANHMLTISLAWVSSDFNPRAEIEKSWAQDKQWQPAYGHVESTVCYYPCSYTLPLIYLAATEYAMIAPEKERHFWIQLARNMSHMYAFLNQNPESETVNGMEWRLFPFLVFSEWGNSQTCWSILEFLMNRVHLQYPQIVFTADLQTHINSEKVNLIINKLNEDAYCTVDPDVDYLVMKSQEGDRIYLALLAEGTNSERHVRLGESLFKTVCGDCNNFELFDATNYRSLGKYSRKNLIDGVKVRVDQAIILEVRRV